MCDPPMHNNNSADGFIVLQMWLCRGNGAQVHNSERDPETRPTTCETPLHFSGTRFWGMFGGVAKSVNVSCITFRQSKWFSTTSTQKSFMPSSKSLSIYCTSGKTAGFGHCEELLNVIFAKPILCLAPIIRGF